MGLRENNLNIKKYFFRTASRCVTPIFQVIHAQALNRLMVRSSGSSPGKTFVQRMVMAVWATSSRWC